MKNSYKERRKNVSNYSIIELLEQFGYTPIKKGTMYYSLKEHDSFMINIQKNTWTQYSSGKGGDVLSLLVDFIGDNQPKFKNIMYSLSYLEKMMNIHPKNTVSNMNSKKK